MPMPAEVRRTILARLDDLIKRGEQFKLEESWETAPRLHSQMIFQLPGAEPPPPVRHRTVRMDWNALDQWRSSCVMFLERVLPKRPSLTDTVTQIHDAHVGEELWKRILSRLRAIREEVEHGLLDELSDTIEAEIAANCMAQAEDLLGEGGAVARAYIPAAVLAGAVLERHLRELCSKQSPPVDTLGASGKPKTLDPLIADLARVGAINPTRATLMRGWAAMRNRAAHGEWDQFTREDVEGMVRGVRQVIAGL